MAEQPSLFDALSNITQDPEPRSWRLEIPAPVKWINVNEHHRHWGPKARLTKEWRDAALMYARKAKLPKGLAHIRIDATLHFTSRLARDAANYGDTLKGVVDGLCRDKSHVNKNGKTIHAPGYGLIWDDSTNYLDGPFLRIGDPVSRRTYPLGLLVLDITEDGAV